MKCPICNLGLTRTDFELFNQDKFQETYGYYKCDHDHRIEFLEKLESLEKTDKGYKRYKVFDKTYKMCPICNENMNHISDDVTSYPDWIFHYNRYQCKGLQKHIMRIFYEKLHNNEEMWRTFDKKAFGYDTEDDLPGT